MHQATVARRADQAGSGCVLRGVRTCMIIRTPTGEGNSLTSVHAPLSRLLQIKMCSIAVSSPSSVGKGPNQHKKEQPHAQRHKRRHVSAQLRAGRRRLHHTLRTTETVCGEADDLEIRKQPDLRRNVAYQRRRKKCFASTFICCYANVPGAAHTYPLTGYCPTRAW